MALSQERIGQIAMLAIMDKMERDGVMLNPREVKREIANSAKRLGIPARELSEFMKAAIKTVFDKTMVELDSIK